MPSSNRLAAAGSLARGPVRANTIGYLPGEELVRLPVPGGPAAVRSTEYRYFCCWSVGLWHDHSVSSAIQ